MAAIAPAPSTYILLHTRSSDWNPSPPSFDGRLFIARSTVFPGLHGIPDILAPESKISVSTFAANGSMKSPERTRAKLVKKEHKERRYIVRMRWARSALPTLPRISACSISILASRRRSSLYLESSVLTMKSDEPTGTPVMVAPSTNTASTSTTPHSTSSAFSSAMSSGVVALPSSSRNLFAASCMPALSTAAFTALSIATSGAAQATGLLSSAKVKTRASGWSAYTRLSISHCPTA